MKTKEELIGKAIKEVYENLKEEFHHQTISVSKIKVIDDVEPLNLLKFMKDNDIPNNATFNVCVDDEDSEYFHPALFYIVKVPLDDSKKEGYIKYHLSDRITDSVAKVMTDNGFEPRPERKVELHTTEEMSYYCNILATAYEDIEKDNIGSLIEYWSSFYK